VRRDFRGTFISKYARRLDETLAELSDNPTHRAVVDGDAPLPVRSAQRGAAMSRPANVTFSVARYI
jgi:hypothetical protein